LNLERPLLFVFGVVAALALFAAFVAAERRKTSSDLAYSNLDFFIASVRPRRWIPLLLRAGLIAALLCTALAVAGPRLVFPVPVRDGAVFICIDTSGSMASTDVIPTRAEAAKNAARAFVDETPPGTRIGIITFATGASMVQPLTSDREQVRSALATIPPPNGATAIGDALQMAERNLPDKGHRVVILVTDGVNNTGIDPDAVASDLGAGHIPVYTIGIGTPNGDMIGGTQATIDEPALQGYAQESGGTYARAEDAVQLHDALARLGRLTSFEPRKVNAEFGFLFAGAMLFAATLFGGMWAGRFP
jgi:Ca-activated chloride channel family protein